jgi:hypothetical protein
VASDRATEPEVVEVCVVVEGLRWSVCCDFEKWEERALVPEPR